MPLAKSTRVRAHADAINAFHPHCADFSLRCGLCVMGLALLNQLVIGSMRLWGVAIAVAASRREEVSEGGSRGRRTRSSCLSSVLLRCEAAKAPSSRPPARCDPVLPGERKRSVHFHLGVGRLRAPTLLLFIRPLNHSHAKAKLCCATASATETDSQSKNASFFSPSPLTHS